MEHYVTLFDSFFLPQGLALHASLDRHCRPYTLWILCVDIDAYRVLKKLALPQVRLLNLDKLETDELRRVKLMRTRGEYCWTLTPFAPRFVFEADATVERVTYLDADLWFRKAPLPIFREFEQSGKGVLITDHGYAPEYDQSATSGQYCVQFVIFSRAGGEHVRQWWEARCIEWCHDRFEDNKFGDQKYLDDWPERFGTCVHVLRHQEWTLAPWNAVRFPYGNALLYHFQDLRLVEGARITFGAYPLPPVLVRHVYEPYLESFVAALDTLRGVGFEPRAQERSPGFLTALRTLGAGILGQRWRADFRQYRDLARLP